MSLIKNSINFLGLQLNGIEDWSSPLEPIDQAQESRAADSTGWNTELGRATLVSWTTNLDDDLPRLALVAKKSPQLRTMQLQAFSETHPPAPYYPRRDYLVGPTIRDLICVKTLTVLDLDTCGTNLVSRQDGSDCHICPSIGALLTTLRRLPLRMRRICPEVLRPQTNDTALQLIEVVVNLSLSNESPMTTSAAHSVRCGSTDRGFAQLQTDIEDHARALIPSMTSPKVIRVLTHSLPQF